MANEFLDIRMPVDIERGAVGGPRFNTTVNEQQSGYEQRNQNWTQPLRMWSFNYGMDNRSKFQELLNFFNTVRGRAYSFRFKDWSDFELTNEVIGVGDNVNLIFQIIKTYDVSSSNALVRPIKRPVNDGNLVVTVNDILQATPADYSVDYVTGIITFAGGSVPAAGLFVKVTCEFDIRVRFTKDSMDVQLGYYKTGSVNSTGIKEIRE